MPLVRHKNDRRGRTLAVVVGAVVMVGMALGTAGAHHAPVTSGEIKNRTIRAVDQRTGSTTTRVIKNRGVLPRDLSAAARRAPFGNTIRGAIGLDVNADAALFDWGTIESLPIPASSPLGDDDVHIVTGTWTSGDVGQTAPTSSDGNAGCTGTLDNPTAPPGDVCIYIAGGDNAQDVNGYSVRPGTGTSPYGFKLAWTNTNAGDSFIDAVWAYRVP